MPSQKWLHLRFKQYWSEKKSVVKEGNRNGFSGKLRTNTVPRAENPAMMSRRVIPITKTQNLDLRFDSEFHAWNSTDSHGDQNLGAWWLRFGAEKQTYGWFVSNINTSSCSVCHCLVLAAGCSTLARDIDPFSWWHGGTLRGAILEAPSQVTEGASYWLTMGNSLSADCLVRHPRNDGKFSTWEAIYRKPHGKPYNW